MIDTEEAYLISGVQVILCLQIMKLKRPYFIPFPGVHIILYLQIMKMPYLIPGVSKTLLTDNEVQEAIFHPIPWCSRYTLFTDNEEAVFNPSSSSYILCLQIMKRPYLIPGVQVIL